MARRRPAAALVRAPRRPGPPSAWCSPSASCGRAVGAHDQISVRCRRDPAVAAAPKRAGLCQGLVISWAGRRTNAVPGATSVMQASPRSGPSPRRRNRSRGWCTLGDWVLEASGDLRRAIGALGGGGERPDCASRPDLPAQGRWHQRWHNLDAGPVRFLLRLRLHFRRNRPARGGVGCARAAVVFPKTAESTRQMKGVPKEIRTPVTALKGPCPGPLDDGDV